MKTLDIPEGLERKELFAFLKKNKDVLILQKKSIAKEGTGFAYRVAPPAKMLPGCQAKADGGLLLMKEAGVLNVKAVINTTNWLDSCLDCHMPGIWDKSLSENKMLMHVQEHNMAFDKIIADGADLKAYVKNMTWKELGFDYKGKTQALVFDSNVKEVRNPFMYNQYAQGYVKNHSAYMMYVKIVLCVNEENDLSYGAEYEAWQKYYPEIANKELADDRGYFWAILEAKIIEGSAVPLGANIVTPTLAVTQKAEPVSSTPSIYSLNLGTPAKGFKVGNVQFKKMLQ